VDGGTRTTSNPKNLTEGRGEEKRTQQKSRNSAPGPLDNKKNRGRWEQKEKGGQDPKKF